MTTPTPSSINSAPMGFPIVYGWDGVGSNMVMAAVIDGYNAQPDPRTLTFNGKEWVTAPAAMTAPVLGKVVYDSDRKREILLGRYDVNSKSEVDSTWEWDGTSWRQQATAHSRGSSSQYLNGAYSPELRATVAFGVTNYNGNATELYDGTDWRKVEAAHQPASPAFLAYDSAHHSVLALSLANYQTWRFDGRDWLAIPQDGGPNPGRAGQSPAVAFDEDRSQWVVFGGLEQHFNVADTWTGDGTTWQRQSPATTPIARLGFPGYTNMAWDPNQHKVLMFGGISTIVSGKGYGDTWAWDGSGWAYVAGKIPSPMAIPPSAPAYATALIAGMAGVEAKTGLVYSDGVCGSTPKCLTNPRVFGNPDAFTAAYVQMGYSGSGGTDCFAYVFPDNLGWHYSSPVVCPRQAGFNPVLGAQDQVSVSDGCANVRLAPNLSSRVVACLKDGTLVSIDSDFPRYVDSHIWWSINSHQGWMAHDSLINSSQ